MVSVCGCAQCIAANSEFSGADIALANYTGTNADELQSGTSWSNNRNGLTLTYKFHQAYESYWAQDRSSPYSASGMTGFSADQKDAVQQILGMISSFTKISFTETTGTVNPQIGFINANATEVNLGGSAYYPTGWQGAGDIFVNKNFWGFSGSQAQGSTNFLILMHEVGHALGLRHSFDGLSGALATEQYSVMAYDHTPWGSVNPGTYMLYDIAALQDLYGANTSYNSGNTTYAVSATKASTIWDGGGIDTIDGSSYSGGMTINLTAGTYSSIGLTENLAIAYNVIIENAIGSNGNDTVYGNQADNIIQLGNGNDTVYVSTGMDVVDGGAGTDTMRFDKTFGEYLYRTIGSAVEISENLGTSLVTSVENFFFAGVSKSWTDIQLAASNANPNGLPSLNRILLLDPVNVSTIADNNSINTGAFYAAKTIAVAFETGADVTTRQVIYEQGGGLRGLNIYIENGKLYEGVWNCKAGTSWGWREIDVAVQADTAYTTTFIFNATDASTGTITGYLNGTQFGQASGTGYLYGHAEDIGIGKMADQSRYHGDNEYGDGHIFSGDIGKLIQYSSALSGASLTQLNQYASYRWTDMPVAKDDSFVTPLNTAIAGNVLADNGSGADSDPDSDTLTVTAATLTTAGGAALSLSSNGSFTYTPLSNYTGTDSFTYTVNDGNGGSATGTVSLIVGNPPPEAPSANRILLLDPVAVTTLADNAALNTGNYYAAKTIAVAFETGADVTTRQVIYEQGGGLRGLNIYIENGKLYEGVWNYKAGTSWGWREIDVAIAASTAYTATLVFNAIDSSQGTITGYLNGAQFGQASGTGYLYGHAEDIGIGKMADQSRYHGDNEYGDGHIFSGDIGTIVQYSTALTGSALNDLQNFIGYRWIDGPTAQDDNFAGAVNAVISGNVLANNGRGIDNDPNNDPLNVSASTFMTAGGASVSLLANGNFTYTPASGYSGKDSFSYTVNDGQGGHDLGTVNLVVGNPPPEAPSANRILLLDPVAVTTLADNAALNTGNYYAAKTIAVAFETGADVTTRQVLYEQGGGLRGLNIYIENGKLYEGVWNYKAGTSWGWREIDVAIAASTAYTATLVFNAIDSSQGTITGYLNGAQFGQASGTGYLYGHAEDIGIGKMADQSRFHGDNEYGDGHVFTGTVAKLIGYSSALSGSGLAELHEYAGYRWIDGPTARDDSFVTPVNTVIAGNVLADNGRGADSDPDNDPLNISAETLTTTRGASVSLLANGNFTYTPASGYSGKDSFSYTVNDGQGGHDLGTVNLVVGTPPPEAPSANRILLLDPVAVTTLADNAALNTGNYYAAKTIALAFETGADVMTKQVLYEQGGGLRGLNVYIENGKLYEGVWNYKAGTSWGWREIDVAVQADTDYTATFIFNASGSATGSITGYLNGAQFGQASGTGYLYGHSEDIGIGRMVDQSRFHGDNEYADGHIFTGDISKLVEYSTALSGSDLTQLEDYLGSMLNNAPASIIDVSDLLQSHDPLQNAINDFMASTENQGNAVANTGSGGGVYASQTIAAFSDTTGLDGDPLLQTGALTTV